MVSLANDVSGGDEVIPSTIAVNDDARAPSSSPSSSSVEFVKRKLITREDPYHLHKILGTLSLVSFTYRYAWVYPTTGTLGFTGSTLDWVTMALHLLLSCSSIIFKVLSARIEKNPLVIWEEYRLHTMTFTLRCVSVFALAAYDASVWSSSHPPTSTRSYVNYASVHRTTVSALVMSHHLLADAITRRWGIKGLSTVRGKDTFRRKPVKMWIITRLFGLYQFLALASHLATPFSLDSTTGKSIHSPLERAKITMGLGFNAILAIQSSAFLMTLNRKNIIPYHYHTIVYSSFLVLSSYHVLRVFPPMWILAWVIPLYAARNFGMDKYLIWAIFFVYGVMHAEPRAENISTSTWSCLIRDMSPC